MTAQSARTVTLRDEKDGRDSRHLCAWLDERGNLRPSDRRRGVAAISLEHPRQQHGHSSLVL